MRNTLAYVGSAPGGRCGLRSPAGQRRGRGGSPSGL